MFGLLLFSPLHNFISVISVKFLCKSYGGHAALRTTYPYGPGKCWEQFHCCTKRCNLINHQDTFLSSLTRAPELSKGPAQQKQKASRGRNSCISQARRICLFWETTGISNILAKPRRNDSSMMLKRKLSERDSFVWQYVFLYALHWGRTRVFSSIMNFLLVRVNLCQ